MRDGILGRSGLARHDLVWITPDAWAEMLRKPSDSLQELREDAVFANWAVRHRPLVVRRPMKGETPDAAPLALTLPLTHARRRIAVLFAPGAIDEVARAPRLVDAAASAPRRWHATIERLLRLQEGVRCYGSLAWQHLTGLPYLRDDSDIDLLWRHESIRSSEALLGEVQAIEAEAPMRIDGELVAADGVAVNWREVHSNASQVLAKALDCIAVVSRRDFLAGRASTWVT